MTGTKLAPRPKVDSQDLATFLLIVEQYPPGTEIHVDMLRDDLDAAQIDPARLGGLFGAAVSRGVLTPTGRIKRCRKASRRNGYAQIYKRPRPRTLPKTVKTSRPSTKRTDTKGPRR